MLRVVNSAKHLWKTKSLWASVTDSIFLAQACGANVLPLTTKDLRQLFYGRNVAELGLPDVDNVDWGVLDYFGWIHPSGQLGFVAVPLNDGLRGLRLRRISNPNSRPRTRMCSWCHHVYRHRGTALFTTSVVGSDGRRSIGNHVCSHLDCSLRIRNLTSDPSTYLPESMHIDYKVRRLQNSLTMFLSRANALS